jgi:hypothetical protein
MDGQSHNLATSALRRSQPFAVRKERSFVGGDTELLHRPIWDYNRGLEDCSNCRLIGGGLRCKNRTASAVKAWISWKLGAGLTWPAA